MVLVAEPRALSGPRPAAVRLECADGWTPGGERRERGREVGREGKIRETRLMADGTPRQTDHAGQLTRPRRTEIRHLPTAATHIDSRWRSGDNRRRTAQLYLLRVDAAPHGARLRYCLYWFTFGLYGIVF